MSSRQLVLLGDSLLLAATVAAAASIGGAIVGGWLFRQSLPVRRRARWILVALITLPPFFYIYAAAFLPAWWGAVLAQTLQYLPLATLAGWAAWETTDCSALEAGLLVATPWRWRYEICLPVIRGPLLAVFGLVLCLALGDASAPSTFGVPVYAVELLSEFSSSHSASAVAALSMPLLCIAALALSLTYSGLRQAALEPASASNAVRKAPVPRGWRALEWLALATFILASLLIAARLIEPWRSSPLAAVRAIAEARDELAATALAALIVSLACCVVAYLAAPYIARSRVLWILLLLALIAPAPLVSSTCVMLAQFSPLRFLYGGVGLWLLVLIARCLPAAALITAVHHARVDPKLRDAARVFARSRADYILRGDLAFATPAMLGAGAVVFVLVIGEFAASLLVLPPGVIPLSVRLYNLLHYGAHDAAGAISGAVAVAVLLLARIVAPK